MLTRNDFLRIASSYNTAMSRAMLRALGVDAKEPVRPVVIDRSDKYKGIRECFNQKHGIRQ